MDIHMGRNCGDNLVRFDTFKMSHVCSKFEDLGVGLQGRTRAIRSVELRAYFAANRYQYRYQYPYQYQFRLQHKFRLRLRRDDGTPSILGEIRSIFGH